MKRITAQHHAPALHTALVFFALSLLAFYFLEAPILRDSDSAWHIAAGRLILETGSPYHTNTWSFTAPDYRWHNLSWLWDALLALIEKNAGIAHLFTLTIVMKAATLALLAYSIQSRVKAGFDPLMLSVALAALVMLHSAGCRPQLITYVLVVVFHYILHRHRTNFSILLCLPFLMILWVNTHGGYLAGFIITGVYGVVALLEKNTPLVKNLLVIGVLMALATLINPWGWGIYLGVYDTLGKAESMATVQEWQPLTFTVFQWIDLFMFTLLLSGAFTEKSIPREDKLLALVCLVMTLYGARNGVMFAVLTAPMLAHRLQLLLPNTSMVSPLKRFTISHIMLLLVIVITLCGGALRDGVMPKQQRVNATQIPEQEIAYLLKHHHGARILNAYSYGGYLIYFGDKNLSIFQDGRAATAYPPEALAARFDNEIPDGLDDVITRYDVRVAMVPNHLKLPLHSRFTWNAEYTGENATIYTRSK